MRDYLSGDRQHDGTHRRPGTSALVVNYKSRTVSIIALSTNRVATTVKIGKNPESVLLTAGGKFALVIDEGSASVTAINIKTHKTRTTTVGKDPGPAAETPDGKTLWYSSDPDAGSAAKPRPGLCGSECFRFLADLNAGLG